MTNNNNLKLKKIGWFKRLFYSWNKLVNYFENNLKENELQRQKFEELLIGDLKSKLTDHLDERIKKLQKNDNEFYDLKTKNKELDKENETLKKIKIKSSDYEQKINELKDEIKTLTSKNNEYLKKENQINNNIISNTNVLKKIDNLFFGNTKQIGNFAEKGIELIFEDCGIERDKFWVKDLEINGGRVEYAFRLNINEEKWIPIDVKSFFSVRRDENNNIKFNELLSKIESAAKDINKKYVKKENTQEFGMMIIPNDSLCLEVSRRYVKKIKEIYDNYNVVIASPSMFLQLCYILGNSFLLSQKFHKDQKFHEDVKNLMYSVKVFIDDVNDIRSYFEKLQNKFHFTIDTHYTKTKKQYEKLSGELKLDQNEKYRIEPEITKKMHNEN